MAKTFTHTFQSYNVKFSSRKRPSYFVYGNPIEKVPSIIWESGMMWTEASMFLAKRSIDKHVLGASLSAVVSDGSHLCSYAQFLEDQEIAWNKFPKEIYKRPTYMFRGHLIRLRNERSLAPSTIRARMLTIVRFYKWCYENRLLEETNSEAFLSREQELQFINSFGGMQSKKTLTTDLSIAIRSAKKSGLEQGLYPISSEDRDVLLENAKGVVSQEYLLMLKLGFFSGVRMGTIVDLNVEALLKAEESHNMVDAKSIPVGPQYGIHTKAGVSYQVSIPNWLWLELLIYSRSTRRLIRSAKAKPKEKDRVFITQRGNGYGVNTTQGQMSKLRLFAPTIGLDLDKFYFHCTRATFGSVLVKDMLIKKYDESRILATLMKLMGHSNSASSMRYVKFFEEVAKYDPIQKKWENIWGDK